MCKCITVCLRRVVVQDLRVEENKHTFNNFQMDDSFPIELININNIQHET